MDSCLDDIRATGVRSRPWLVYSKISLPDSSKIEFFHDKWLRHSFRFRSCYCFVCSSRCPWRQWLPERIHRRNDAGKWRIPRQKVYGGLFRWYHRSDAGAYLLRAGTACSTCHAFQGNNSRTGNISLYAAYLAAGSSLRSSQSIQEVSYAPAMPCFICRSSRCRIDSLCHNGYHRHQDAWERPVQHSLLHSIDFHFHTGDTHSTGGKEAWYAGRKWKCLEDLQRLLRRDRHTIQQHRYIRWKWVGR